MKKQNRKAIIIEICALYGRETSLPLVNAWTRILDTLSDEEVALGMARLSTEYTGTYMPPPGVFVELAKGYASQDAENAWNLMMESIKKIGTYRSVAFKDGNISEFIRNNGGWTQIGQKTDEDMKWLKKNFLSVYGDLRGLEINPFLTGLTEMQNRTNGRSTDPDQIEWIGEFSDEDKTQLKLEYKSGDTHLKTMVEFMDSHQIELKGVEDL